MQTLILRPSVDIRRFNPIKSCLWDFKFRKWTGSQKDELNSSKRWRKTCQCHLQILWLQNLQLRKWELHLPPVIHCSPPVNVLAKKLKNNLFSKKSGEGSKERVCLIRQPARAFTQATRGVDRLSSAVWEEAELQDRSPTHRGQASGCR